MKAKKYTNSSWTEGDYEKKYSTATDTYTTLPATFQTSGADVVNYQVYGTPDGAGEETENLFDKNNINIVKAFINSNDTIADYGTNGLIYIPVVAGNTYTFLGFKRASSATDIRW